MMQILVTIPMKKKITKDNNDNYKDNNDSYDNENYYKNNLKESDTSKQ